MSSIAGTGNHLVKQTLRSPYPCKSVIYTPFSLSLQICNISYPWIYRTRFQNLGCENKKDFFANLNFQSIFYEQCIIPRHACMQNSLSPFLRSSRTGPRQNPRTLLLQSPKKGQKRRACKCKLMVLLNLQLRQFDLLLVCKLRVVVY